MKYPESHCFVNVLHGQSKKPNVGRLTVGLRAWQRHAYVWYLVNSEARWKEYLRVKRTSVDVLFSNCYPTTVTSAQLLEFAKSQLKPKMKFSTAALVAMIAVANASQPHHHHHQHAPPTTTAAPTMAPTMAPTPVPTPIPVDGNMASIMSDTTSASASGDTVVAVGADQTSGSAAAAGNSVALAGAEVGFAGGFAESSPSL